VSFGWERSVGVLSCNQSRGEGGALVSAASQQAGVGGLTHEFDAD